MDTEICLIINHFAIICEYVPCFQGFETYQDTRKVTSVLVTGHGAVPSRLPNKERRLSTDADVAKLRATSRTASAAESPIPRLWPLWADLHPKTYEAGL